MLDGENKLKKQNTIYPYLICLMIIACLSASTACGGKNPVSPDQGQTPHGAQLMDNTYRKIVIHNFEADQDVIRTHPNTATLCQEAAFRELMKIGTIPMIVKTASTFTQETNTIIMKVHLRYRREKQQLQSKSKTVPEKITAQLRLIDASNGKTVHENNITLSGQTSNKSGADTSELGKLIARYVSHVMGGK